MLQLALQLNKSVLERMLISYLWFIRFISGSLFFGTLAVLLRQEAINRFSDMTYTAVSLFRWCVRFHLVINTDMAAEYCAGVIWIVIDRAFLSNGLQEPHTINKVHLPDNHHQIDGVKMFLTVKASGQIGLWVYRGIKLVAQGAKKTKAALCHPARDVQGFFDKPLNVNLVSHGIKLAGGKAAFSHLSSPDPAWVLS